MMGALVHSTRARLLVLVVLCVAVVVGALTWYASRDGGGTVMVSESPRPGWKTIRYEDVRVTIPAEWERADRGDCEFEFEFWAPPDTDECEMAAGVAFYASATFDPAQGPGVVRGESPAEPDWGGYTYSGDFAVHVSDNDRDVVQRVLHSAH